MIVIQAHHEGAEVITMLESIQAVPIQVEDVLSGKLAHFIHPLEDRVFVEVICSNISWG